MNIFFNKEADGSLSATSFDAEYDGYMHDELYWCDINQSLGAVMVRWQDDYQNPEHFDDLGAARKHVLKNYSNHKPFSNGRKYEL